MDLTAGHTALACILYAGARPNPPHPVRRKGRSLDPCPDADPIRARCMPDACRCRGHIGARPYDVVSYCSIAVRRNRKQRNSKFGIGVKQVLKRRVDFLSALYNCLLPCFHEFKPIFLLREFHLSTAYRSAIITHLLPRSSRYVSAPSAAPRTWFSRCLRRGQSMSCDIHTHAPAQKSSTNLNFILYPFFVQTCSINWLGHGHGYEWHSSI